MDQRDPERGVCRRRLLTWSGAAAAGALVGGCPARGPIRVTKDHLVLYARLRGQRYRFDIERALRAGPLGLNRTTTLRRYAGHATPAAREAQLVGLCWTADHEEAFFHTQPDNVWTEVGALTEHGMNRAGVHGVRPLPIRSLLSLYSGRVQGVGRPRSLVSYHFHPLKLARRTLRAMEPRKLRRLGGLERLVKMVYLPSASDFSLHARLRRAFGGVGTAVRSRVAVPDAIIEYRASAGLAEQILAGRAVEQIPAMRIYEQARLLYARQELGRREFSSHLAAELKKAGLPEHVFELTVHRRGVVETDRD